MALRKRYSSKKKSSPKRTLSEEQLQKMAQGRAEAAKKRQEAAQKAKSHAEKMEMLRDLEKSLAAASGAFADKPVIKYRRRRRRSSGKKV